MSGKAKTTYICRECGYESVKWNGRCPSCGEWNTLEENVSVSMPKTSTNRKTVDLSEHIVSLSGVDTKEDNARYSTGVKELDRVLGGGLVKGSLVLLGGEPGIGKSTLLLQICEYIGQNYKILYVSGEESARQIKLRADRLKVSSENLYILAQTDAQAISDTVIKNKPDVVIIDSIQTMSITQISSSPGSVTQVRECTNLFMRVAKSEEIPFLIVGHVNKDGAIAGPKVMEHIVDAVLYFEGQRNMSYRILRAVKNRFGSTNEIGIFEMLDSGLREVTNPSLMLLQGRPHNVSGSCVACIMEGSRPVLAEVQTLVSKSTFSAPRRMTTGIDYNRVAIIIAVLEKRLGFTFSTLDVYINIVGGLRIDEPAADLSIAMALYSSITDKCINENVIAFGEVGLGGEIRNVSHIVQRITEAQRLGFEICIIPKLAISNINTDDFSITIKPVSNLKEAFNIVNKKERQ